ncbi:MAG: VanZ family protein [Desulfatitalea sp.]|nr:VanZ family protein [Desulfatitalea sp.]NNK01047.1 VanZ family protein [Desulfatitalea sp.]
MRHMLCNWLPVVVWCAIIFFQSAFATPDLGPAWPLKDKLLHAGAYALLAVLLCRALNTYDPFRGRPVRLLLACTLLTTLYGLSDEWHQSFVAARTAEAADLVADSVGAVLGCGLFLRFKGRGKEG